MAILHDVTTVIATGSTSASPIAVNHNAGAGCGGVIVCITIGGASTDVVSGVTYGGIAMTRIRFDQATSTENGCTYIFFLGEGKVPQVAGNQSCSVAFSGTTAKSITCTTVKSSVGWKRMSVAQIGGYTNSGVSTETRLNLGPAGSGSSMAFEAAFSGTSGPMSSTAVPFGGMTTMVDDITGNLTGGTFRQTNASEGSFTMGHTQSSDDWCSSGISVIEAGMADTFTFPTPEWDPTYEISEAPAPVVSKLMVVSTGLPIKVVTMGVQYTVLTSGSDATSATSYTTASGSPAANSLILVLTQVFRSGADASTPTISGGGMTSYDSLADVGWGGLAARQTNVWRAMQSNPGSGTIGFNLGGVTHDGMAWVVLQVTGVVTTGSNGADAVRQTVTGNGNAASRTITLAALGSGNNHVLGWFTLATQRTVTLGSGFRELSQFNQATPAGHQLLEYSVDDITVDASWDLSTGNAAIGMELVKA